MKRDYTPYNQQGDAYEELLKPRLEKFFNTMLIKSDNRYSHYDFITQNEDIMIELKARNYMSTDFKTTLISKKKMNYINQQPKFYIFIYFIKNDVLMYCNDFKQDIITGTSTYEHKYKNYTVENVLLDLSKFHIVDNATCPNE